MDYPKTVPGVSLLNGKFTDGDEINNVPASLDPASWANSLTDELLNIVRAASITPNEKKYDQVLKAIQKLIANAMPNIPDVSSFIQGFSLVPVRAVAGRNTSTGGDHGTVTHSISLHQSEKNAVKNVRYALVTVRTIVDVHLSEKGHSHLNTRSKSSISSSPQFCHSSMGLDPTPSGWGFRNEITMRDNNLFIVPVVNGKISLVGELSLFIDHAGIVRTPNTGYYAYAGYVAYLIGVA